jgi:hypothetical protein
LATSLGFLVLAILILGTIASLHFALKADFNAAQARDALADVQIQKVRADEERNTAQKERNEAERMRALAERRENVAERNLYATQMALAHQAWGVGDTHKALELLLSYFPIAGEKDRRGFEWFYLWKLCHPQSFELREHTSGIHKVVFAPDGSLIATTSGDGTVKLWDSINGSLTATLKGHQGTVFSADFSPDGNTLATASNDESILLWDLHSGTIKSTLPWPRGTVYAVAFSRDGKTLAAGGTTGVINLFNWRTQQLTGTLHGHKGEIRAIEYSSDDLLCSAGSDGQTISWDLEHAKPRHIFSGHTSGVLNIAYSPDGSQMITAGWDGVLRLWDVTGDEHIASQPKQ